MEISSIKSKGKISSIRIKVFSILIFMTLIYFSYTNIQLYGISVIIARLTLSILIVTFTVGVNKSKLDYMSFIGITYIISNILYISNLLIFNDMRYLSEALIIRNILESVTIYLIIDNVYKKSSVSKQSTSNVFSIYFVFSIVTYLIIKYNYNFMKKNNLNLYIFEIIVLINVFLLLNTIKKNLYYVKNNADFLECEKFKIINKVIILKLYFFIGLLFLMNVKLLAFDFYALLEVVSILETYYIYKFTVDLNLINPYIKKIEINKKLEEQYIKQKSIGNILKNMLDVQKEIKKEMEYKEDLFYQILSSTPNGWIVFDRNKKITYINNSMKNICSINSNNNYNDINAKLKDVIVNYDEFINKLNELDNTTDTIEYEIQTYSGKYYKCVYSKDEISNERVCIFRDISNEKNMINSMIYLKKEYEKLISSIGCPIIIYDKYNNIIQSSKAYEKLFNNSTVHYEDIEFYNYVMEINKKAMTNKELYDNGVFRYRRIDNDGEVIWIESTVTIFYEGSKKYIVESHSDITYHIENREAIRQSQNMYKALLDEIPEGIYLEDLDTNKYIYVNKKFKDIFKLDEEINDEILGICREDFMKVHPDYNEVVNDNIYNVKQGKNSDYYKIKYFDKDENIIETQVASIPFKVDRKVFKLTIIKDMKDIRKLESLKKQIIEREKKDIIKTQFFINMSHELKTPLNLIFTSTQLIENLYNKGKISDEDEVVKKHIDLTKQNSYRLIKIINDLIDFTKMESGFYKLRLENKNIISIIEDIVMSVVNYASNNNINIVFDTNVEDLIISVDVNAIERILLNILSNAIKFTGDGGNIYVNLIYRNGEVSIEIEDTGIGIPKDKLDHIFDRFNDINKGYIGNVYGSGIGLSIVKSMVNLIGASIKVESELNVGTKFTITMDVNLLDEEEYYYEYGLENSSNIDRLTIGMTDVYKETIAK